LANCWKNNKVSDEGIVWHPDGTTGTGLCKLQEGKTYYLNFINANVQNVQALGLGSASSTKTSHCFSGTCSDPISNGPFGVSQ
jgi:hypothetical protein